MRAAVARAASAVAAAADAEGHTLGAVTALRVVLYKEIGECANKLKPLENMSCYTTGTCIPGIKLRL